VILLGEDPEHARIEFLECSGRWGGALLPITLMNRLFGDWQVQPYAATGLGEGDKHNHYFSTPHPDLLP
jgi:hypothetical protein